MSIEAMKQASDAIINVLAGGDFDNPLADLKQAALALHQAISEAEKREWVELSRDEVLDIEETTTHPLEFYRAIEARLKEKNNG